MFHKWDWPKKNLQADPDDIMAYIVNTGAEGKLSRSGIFQSSDQQLKMMVASMIRYFQSRPGEPKRIMFYCHGGLVSESEAEDAIRVRYQTFLQSGIYPIFFIWESTLMDVLMDQLRETMENRMYEMSAVDTILDEMVEEAARLFPEPWDQMKKRGSQVFSDHGGGWRFFRLLLKALRKEQMQVELHLIGHSAGSIVLATLLQQIMMGEHEVYPYLKIFTCSLLAPACTMDQFEKVYVRSISNRLMRRFFLFTLSDELEQTDPSVPLYNKSILYLVSRGFEGQKGEKPLLGMEIYATQSQSLANLLASGRGAWVVAATDPLPVSFHTGKGEIELISKCKEHGGFSYDMDTLHSLLRIVLNRQQVPNEF